ncbi:type II toxin-antitoxin system RelE/ParE family toxin [Tunicatimonas pelagia]|uniref:type II toxin-antitoxin system RelE/ParE family toxin n=1 Tax=Tunicatimonas pelagia TaxID=931531 RepID=UPI00266712E6|nr:type II toxin-antitoxin system RelE/ParE family toxin [Tunicatimonas pelagia]WKN43712.1 type II toxin-antitoxin system RelE/ParE family toxin [Tunicatimonas pelagia]
MASYKLTEEARDDLRDIYRYGVTQHGQTQADEYYDGLMDKFQYIAENPNFYQAVDYIRKTYRRCVYGEHSIFYRIIGNDVEIMTIIRAQNLPDKLQ